MARYAQDREDLLRDAKAFDRRVELLVRLNGQDVVVFAGFRKAGAVSFYFEADPVYHFNSRGELRRAFVDDRPIKAERACLISWQPRRESNQVQMLRNKMSEQEQRQFCDTLLSRLRLLHTALRNGDYEEKGQVPHESDVVGELQVWLSQLQEAVIARSPGVN
jgi:hypothetical protein